MHMSLERHAVLRASWGDAAGHAWRKLAPVQILALVAEYRERPDEQVVVLFQVLAAEINFGYKFQTVSRTPPPLPVQRCTGNCFTGRSHLTGTCNSIENTLKMKSLKALGCGGSRCGVRRSMARRCATWRG